nr:MAG TPA: hypothetical protein [Caudoviricetes sp.]
MFSPSISVMYFIFCLVCIVTVSGVVVLQITPAPINIEK